MAIYRGNGGAGDSTNDATVSDVTAQAVIASTKADEAAASAAAAAASATSVQTLTAATGAAGSSASYNGGTNTLTVPRGDTGATGAAGDDSAWTGGSYASATGVVTFASDDGLGFVTGDLRGATGSQGIQGIQGIQGATGATGAAGADGTNGTNGSDGTDGEDTVNTATVTAAGALMDSELTNLAAVKALNQSLVTTATPTFAEITSTGDVNLTAGASDWAFTVTGNNLIISYGGTSKAKLDTSGNLIVIGNVTAFGSI